MTTVQKVIVSTGLILALLLSIVGLVGGNQSVTTVDESSIVSRVVAQVKSALGGVTNLDKLALNSVSNRGTVTSTSTIMQSQRGIIRSGSDRDYYQNLTGRTMCWDEGIIQTNGTASSSASLWMWVSTTTSPTSRDYIADASFLTGGLNGRALIGGVSLATSTAATTTNSLDQQLAAASRAVASAGVVCAQSNEYLNVQVKTTCHLQGVCEQATSSNFMAGQPIEWFARSSFATSTNEQ